MISIFTLMGCVLLGAAIVYHLYKGYPRLGRSIEDGDITLPVFSRKTAEELSVEEIRVLWISFAAHLVAVVIIAITSSISARLESRVIVFICGMVPVFDAILLTYFIRKAVHPGAIILALAGIFIMVGAVQYG